MPLYQRWEDPDGSQMAIWQISEPETFFSTALDFESDRKHAIRRLEHLAGRYLLHLLIPGITIKNICINKLGKPFHPDFPVQFSITHSYPYVAAAMHAHQPVGIDLQMIVPKIQRLQHKFLSPIEQQLTHNDLGKLTLAWTAKEAAFKWFGEGQVDFIRQMPITNMEITGRSAISCINFLRSEPNQQLLLPGGIEADFAWSLVKSGG